MNTISTNLVIVLLVIILIATAYNFWQIMSFKKMKKTFFAGQNALNLEQVILSLQESLQDSITRQENIEQEILRVKENLDFAVTKVGLVRFNPFQGSGGNFSFCLALLDAHNTGIIITSMYGRDQNRIYTKKLDYGKCESKLTEEEEQAILAAHGK